MLFPKLNKFYWQNIKIIWQKDGEPSHPRLPEYHTLNERFSDCWISRPSYVLWRPRDPDPEKKPTGFFISSGIMLKTISVVSRYEMCDHLQQIAVAVSLNMIHHT